MDSILCAICNTTIHIKGFGVHIQSKHNITKEAYYLKYIGAMCYCHCGSPGIFKKLSVGYTNYCCKEHYYETPEYKVANEKISKSYERRDMTKWMEKRKKTNVEKYGVEHVSQMECHAAKSVKTQIERYGKVKNFSDSEQRASALKSYIEKIDNINDLRKQSYYDNENKKLVALEKRRAAFIKLGIWQENLDQTELYKYRISVRKHTRHFIDEIYETWNGLDYYTQENIQHLPEVDITIDHKVSIFYGYIINIPASEIGDISNLCICSRESNSRKNKRTEHEYKKLLEQNRIQAEC